MYYRIDKSGCSERDGEIQIRYDCYLDDGELGYTLYSNLVDGVVFDNPFCCHFRQFPYDVTDKEIIDAGEEIIEMAYSNFQAGKLHENHNKGVRKEERKQKDSKERISSIIATDWKEIANSIKPNNRMR